MYWQKICFGSEPLLDQGAVLAILGSLFLLLVWRTVRRPQLPPWSITRRSR